MRIRVIPTGSGKYAVQVVSKRYGILTVHKHIGTFKDASEKSQLYKKAKEFITEATHQGNLLDLLSSCRPSDVVITESRPLLVYQLFLKEALKGKANVIKADEALKDGLFGHGDLHTRFKGRIGDILLLPERNLTLYYERPYRKEFNMLGMHGGLSPDEMLVPFAAVRISDLL